MVWMEIPYFLQSATMTNWSLQNFYYEIPEWFYITRERPLFWEQRTEKGQVELVTWMIASGRRVEFESDKKIGTALEVAQKKGFKEIQSLLEILQKDPARAQRETRSGLGIQGEKTFLWPSLCDNSVCCWMIETCIERFLSQVLPFCATSIPKLFQWCLRSHWIITTGVLRTQIDHQHWLRHFFLFLFLFLCFINYSSLAYVLLRPLSKFSRAEFELGRIRGWSRSFDRQDAWSSFSISRILRSFMFEELEWSIPACFQDFNISFS